MSCRRFSGALTCLALVFAAGCSQGTPARTSESGQPAAQSAPEPAAPQAASTASTAPAAPAAQPTGSLSKDPSFVLSPPDGKWLTDEEGLQYFILEVPRVEGQYVWEGKDTIRLRGGMPLKLARYDDKMFYAKIFKVEPGDGGPVVRRAPTAADREKAALSYQIEIPKVSRVRLVPFDKGLPRSGQWRNGFDVADMNKDGHLDIVHGAARKGATTPVIFLGDSQGSWRLWQEARFPADVRYDYGDAAVADFNGDGHMDVAVAMHILGLRVLVGDSKGGFKLWSEGLDYRNPNQGEGATGYSSRAIEAVDWNGDRRPDLLALGEGMRLNTTREKQPQLEEGSSFGAAVYLNQGNGTWVRKDKGTDAGQLFGDSLATADFDGDGRLDFATAASFVDKKDIVHLGRNELWETAALDLRPRGYVTAVAAADFDGDRRDDVAVGYVNNELGVLRSGIDIFLARPGKDGLSWERRGLATVEGRSGFYALDTGDLDGDKKFDLVALTGDGQAHIFLGESQGSFARAELPAGSNEESGCRGYDVQLVDLDRDGRDEIVADFAGEQGSEMLVQAMDPSKLRACPTQGSIRSWKTVPAGEAR
jgi:hypothetical protein